MKKVYLALLLLLTLLLLCGCQSEIVYNTSDLVITQAYDAAGRVLQRSELHLGSGITTSYLFTYNSDLTSMYCSDIRVVTIDRNGNIIEESDRGVLDENNY